MTLLTRGLVVAALHVAIVSSLGAKLLVDRSTRPRVWALTAPVDPNLPIRGRYVQLRLVVDAPDLAGQPCAPGRTPVALEAQGDRLVARPLELDPGFRRELRASRIATRTGCATIVTTPLAYFIPDRIPDPSIRAAGEELWVEVTLPRKGPPRPIRLGVKRDGVLSPLEIE